MIRFTEFEQLGAAVAALSDRSDGDCSLRTASDAETALRARRDVCHACGIPATGLVAALQVHGTRVARVGELDRGKGALARETAIANTDGLLTDVRGLPLAIFVADCVPVYLYAPAVPLAALVHAGRQGTFDNIAGRAVTGACREYAVRPQDFHALIGPSAGPCCYEVSPELAQAFADSGLPTRGRHLDLWEANARQLVAAGVPREQIVITALCTLCDGRFHSHRAQPNAGRNMALLML